MSQSPDEMRAAIATAARKVKLVPVEVPEWGMTVYIRPMSAGERDRWEAESLERADKRKESIKVALESARAWFLSKCLADADGNLLYGPETYKELDAHDYRVIDRLNEVARKINGLSEADIEELEKNSAGAPAAGSSSDSASPSAPPSES